MLYLVANDMTPRERKTMSALLWEEAHPELSEAMFGCWNRCDAGTDKKFGTILRGYLCSSIFDKRSTVLELARTSPSAVHFWVEISRLAPQWRNFLPDIDVPQRDFLQMHPCPPDGDSRSGRTGWVGRVGEGNV